MLANRIREAVASTGTGDIILAGAGGKYTRFAQGFEVGTSGIHYTIEAGDNVEIGRGTLVSSTVFRRDVIEETIIGGVHAANPASRIDIQGEAVIFCAATASAFAAKLDKSGGSVEGHLGVEGNLAVTGGMDVSGAVSFGGTLDIAGSMNADHVSASYMTVSDGIGAEGDFTAHGQITAHKGIQIDPTTEREYTLELRGSGTFGQLAFNPEVMGSGGTNFYNDYFYISCVAEANEQSKLQIGRDFTGILAGPSPVAEFDRDGRFNSFVGLQTTKSLTFVPEDGVPGPEWGIEWYTNSSGVDSGLTFRRDGVVACSMGNRYNNRVLAIHPAEASNNISLMEINSSRMLMSVPIAFRTDNTYSIGSPNYRVKDIYVANGVIQTSDGDLKADITDTALGLDFIRRLRPVDYRYKDMPAQMGIIDEETGAEGEMAPAQTFSRMHSGLIAQDVKAALDALDCDRAMYIESPEGMKGLRYEELIAPLIKAVQELAERVEQLERAPQNDV